MGKQRDEAGVLRVALDSISPRWAGWGLAAHAVITLGGFAWAVYDTIVGSTFQSGYDFYTAIGLGLVRAFGISIATIITVAEVIDTAMVIAHFVGQKMKQEGREEGRKEGRQQGRAEAADQFNQRISHLLEAHPELKDEIEPLLVQDE